MDWNENYDWDWQSQKDGWDLKYFGELQNDVLALGGVVPVLPIVMDNLRAFYGGRVERENCDTSDDSTSALPLTNSKRRHQNDCRYLQSSDHERLRRQRTIRHWLRI
jgi:hypothetical protein